ncbi:MAG: glycosyltransferase family 4 protein [Roseiflexaceae bacterium]|nr:glycosyltransferase family 4 protein [Roseiflexaceae bacterium]
MKIGLITESPTVATGFGTRARLLINLLAALGHETVVFAISAINQPFDPADYPCRIVPIARDQLVAIEMVGSFLAVEQPDVLFVHYDLSTACWYIERARADGWNGPVMTHFVIDSLPVSRDLLDVLRTVDVAITPTVTAASYCASAGIEHVIAAPYSVDQSIFHPLPNRAELRRAAGLRDRFVVGVFGRNVERKQQPRVMLAIQRLVQAGLGNDIVLYLHCQPKNDDPWLSTWNLHDVAEQLGLADRVLFPPPEFRQLIGIPYQSDATDLDMTTIATPDRPQIPSEYGYVERLNLCDLVVNVPYNGAFELASIEAQSCGIPVAVTNDRGAIVEVAGDGAILLDPIDIAIHSSGGRQFFVSAQTIADAILEVKQNPILRADCIRRGAINASRYHIDVLADAIRRALLSIDQVSMIDMPV